MSDSSDELRALIREVIRDQLGALRATETVETVDLSTDDDLAAFVARLLALDEAEREKLRVGRKRFHLAVPAAPAAAPPNMPMAPTGPPYPVPMAPSGGGRGMPMAPSARGEVPGAARGPVRRVERGAVTEAMVRDAARAGERLVLGRGAVLTPLAKDRARASGVEIEKER